MDGPDAEASRIDGGGDLHLPTAHQDLTGVRADGAGQDLDQRALAGAVLPQEAVDRPAGDVQADVGERLDAAIAFRSVAD
jgi:hypothetical protein